MMDNTRISNGYKSGATVYVQAGCGSKAKKVLTAKDERIQNTFF